MEEESVNRTSCYFLQTAVENYEVVAEITSIGAQAMARGWGGEGAGGSRPRKIKIRQFFGQKTDAIRAKVYYMDFTCASCILLDDYTYYPRNEYH